MQITCVKKATQPAWGKATVLFLINSTLALLLFIPALLVMGCIYLIQMVSDRRVPRHFLYVGERLGVNRKVFNMYKIRTLQLDSGFEQQGVILPPGSGREIKMGAFLRESRLDELPQLWNVIRGDMNLVGPRPLRPVVYEKLKTSIPGCEVRFLVKPGLTGYAQLLTPSHTPKRIRFAIDNHFVLRGNQPIRELMLIGWTIGIVLIHSVKSLMGQIGRRWRLLRKYGKGVEHRKLKRYHPRHGWMQLSDVYFEKKESPLIPEHSPFFEADFLQPVDG